MAQCVQAARPASKLGSCQRRSVPCVSEPKASPAVNRKSEADSSKAGSRKVVWEEASSGAMSTEAGCNGMRHSSELPVTPAVSAAHLPLLPAADPAAQAAFEYQDPGCSLQLLAAPRMADHTAGAASSARASCCVPAGALVCMTAVNHLLTSVARLELATHQDEPCRPGHPSILTSGSVSQPSADLCPIKIFFSMLDTIPDLIQITCRPWQTRQCRRMTHPSISWLVILTIFTCCRLWQQAWTWQCAQLTTTSTSSCASWPPGA